MKFGICGGPGTNILVDIKGQLEAERTPCLKGGGQEELPHVRGQGQWPRVPDCNGAGTAERSYPASEARGGGQEEQPHVQGAVAARAQEGLEELSHIEGQEGQR